jgi:hypothetical protein
LRFASEIAGSYPEINRDFLLLTSAGQPGTFRVESGLTRRITQGTLMRGAIVIAFAFSLFASLAAAQVPTSGNVFFGYSYYSTNLAGTNACCALLSNRVNANGWEGSFEGRVLPFLGMVADFDGHYGSESVLFPVCPESGCLPGSCPGCVVPNGDFSEHNFLFGPRVSIPVGRFRPFGEFLVGVAHANANGIGTDNSFATAIGGGLDFRIIRPIAWRFQGDYVRTLLFGSTQNNVRISTGIVLRF